MASIGLLVLCLMHRGNNLCTPEEAHVAHIEHNLTRHAGSVNQLILWSFYDYELHVADYALVPFGWKLPHRSPLILYQDGRLFKIHFTTKSQTKTSYDPEVEDRATIPLHHRKSIPYFPSKILPDPPQAKEP